MTNRLWAGCSNRWAIDPGDFVIYYNENWWLQGDSNSWPSGYEPDALTNWAIEPMVERKGVEPSTSCVQNRRSSQMSYPPKWWRRQDLNLRPLRPKRSALPSWATSPINNYTLFFEKAKFFYLFFLFLKIKKWRSREDSNLWPQA